MTYPEPFVKEGHRLRLRADERFTPILSAAKSGDMGLPVVVFDVGFVLRVPSILEYPQSRHFADDFVGTWIVDGQ